MRTLHEQRRGEPAEETTRPAAPGTVPTTIVEAARKAERREIARELHDTVVQPLTALVISLENLHCEAEEGMEQGGVSAAQLAAWKALAREAMQSLRSTMSGATAHPHAQLALPDALRRHLVPQVQSRGLQVTLQSLDWPVDLPPDWTTSLYLTVREALMNVEKHAHATECAVLLRASAEQLAITIVDDGVGFRQKKASQARPTAAGTGFGIGGMRERVRGLGGRLTITTAPGHGVRLEISVSRPGRARSITPPLAATAGPLAQSNGYLY
jgi:signal transduction histidine kinase